MIDTDEKDGDVLCFIREVQIVRPSDSVVEQILRLITNGMLKPGSLLPPERELTRKFGISRNHVREGIKTLELYGLLRPVQGRGTVVTDSGIRGLNGVIKTVLKLTRSDFRALLDTRLLIETETARLAATHRNDDDIRSLDSRLDELRRRIGIDGGLMEDIRLHIAIADMSRNSVLASLVRLVTPDIIAHYRDLRNDNSGGTFAIHRRVVESVQAGDADAAAAFMAEHLADSRRNFLEAIERKRSGRLLPGAR